MSLNSRHFLAASAALCLAAPAVAQAPNPAPPYLTYTLIQQGTLGGAEDVFQLTLYGYEYLPGTLPAVGSPEYVSHSIFALYEAGYETLPNTFPYGASVSSQNTPPGWTFVEDVAFHGGPEGPNDPTVFTLTAPVGVNYLTQQEDHLYDQTFYLYNKDYIYQPVSGKSKTQTLIGAGPVAAVQPIRTEGPTAAVPEPTGPVVFGLGGLVLAGLATRRRRAA